MKSPSRLSPWRIAVLLFACLLLAACNRVTLYNELDERQANQIMGALLGAGIGSEKGPSSTKNGWEVKVSRSDFPYAMQILEARGLPHANYTSLCDVFQKEGFASSAMEERARYICGKQQEIASTLSKISGVVDARVHIALAEEDPLGGNTRDSSASVVIFEQPGARIADRETDLKVFVKDSIEGLRDVNKVTIKFFTIPSAPIDARRDSSVPVSMSAINPLALGGLALAALVGVGVAFRGRLRERLGPAKASAPPPWSGD